MRNSFWRCTLVVTAALSVAMFSTGCRSGGWGIPSSSWVSWGKKKPPTSSIAGTREAPRPPSVSVPPYPAGDASDSVVDATGGYRTNEANSSPTAPFGTTGSPTGSYPERQTAATGGFETGRYGTGAATASGSPGTQQGFYSPSQSAAGGPVASTADSRNDTYSASVPSYGASSPGTGYTNNFPDTTPYGTTPSYEASSAPTTAPGYGASLPNSGTPAERAGSYTTPPSYGTGSYGAGSSSTGAYGAGAYGAGATNPAAATYGDVTPPASGSGAPVSNYPTPPASGYSTPAPSTNYPTTTSGQSFPGPAAPVGPSSAAETRGTGMGAYGAPSYDSTPMPYAAAPSSYGGAPSSVYGQSNAYGGSANTTSGSYGSTPSGYRPGSTSRNNEVLGPSGSGTRTATPGSAYPTYNR